MGQLQPAAMLVVEAHKVLFIPCGRFEVDHHCWTCVRRKLCILFKVNGPEVDHKPQGH